MVKLNICYLNRILLNRLLFDEWLKTCSECVMMYEYQECYYCVYAMCGNEIFHKSTDMIW